MADAQWTLKVKIVAIDNTVVNKKSKWEVGDNLTIQIEPHATVNMFKQRMGLIVMAHPKHQEVCFPEGVLLDDITKLSDVPGLTNLAMPFLSIKVPPEPVEALVELSEDEGLFKGDEVEAPESPAPDVMSKELTDEEMDKQGALKSEAQDALEDGDMDKAVAKFTEAMMLGGVSAMMVAKRAEMLLKQKRYKAAIEDATAALVLNQDSAKAYRARGKARRFMGEYEGSKADFSQAQKIDYDDGVAEMDDYVKKRTAKIAKRAKQDAAAIAAEMAAAVAAAAEEKAYAAAAAEKKA